MGSWLFSFELQFWTYWWLWGSYLINSNVLLWWLICICSSVRLSGSSVCQYKASNWSFKIVPTDCCTLQPCPVKRVLSHVHTVFGEQNVHTTWGAIRMLNFCHVLTFSFGLSHPCLLHSQWKGRAPVSFQYFLPYYWHCLLSVILFTDVFIPESLSLFSSSVIFVFLLYS